MWGHKTGSFRPEADSAFVDRQLGLRRIAQQGHPLQPVQVDPPTAAGEGNLGRDDHVGSEPSADGARAFRKMVKEPLEEPSRASGMR